MHWAAWLSFILLANLISGAVVFAMMVLIFRR
jgi:hypothetical protein